MSKSKLITADTAKELLEANKAVKAGSAEHSQMMAELWEQVAKKFVYVVSAGKWTMSRLMLKSAKRASLIENLRSLRGLGKMRVR
jgi:hypothetical protein